MQAHGAVLQIGSNTAPKLATDFYDLHGDPATPAVPGKQALLNAQLLLIKSTGAAAKAAMKAGRDFCHTGIGVLKPILGQRWNDDWNAIGFTAELAGGAASPALHAAAIPQLSGDESHQGECLARLHRRASTGKFAAIQATLQARETAKGARWSIKATRDEAFKALRKRLIALRQELGQVLSREDDRWYTFGFRRPPMESSRCPLRT